MTTTKVNDTKALGGGGISKMATHEMRKDKLSRNRNIDNEGIKHITSLQNLIDCGKDILRNTKFYANALSTYTCI